MLQKEMQRPYSTPGRLGNVKRNSITRYFSVNNNTFCFATIDKVFYYVFTVTITRNRMQNPIIKILLGKPRCC
jgi:hypothetical protein